MITDVPAVAKFLEQHVADFTDDAVVGISGGVDSGVVASIGSASAGFPPVAADSCFITETRSGGFATPRRYLTSPLGR